MPGKPTKGLIESFIGKLAINSLILLGALFLAEVCIT